MRASVLLSGLIVAALSLSACGDDDASEGTAARAGRDSARPLPTPEAARGSITGMPDAPGPGQAGLPAASALPPDTPIDSDGNILLPPDDGMPDGGVVSGYPGRVGYPADMGPGEPGPEDAVTVMRQYYAHVNRGSFGNAYALWSDGGRASGQSPQQFANGFANATGVAVELMQPGRVDANAGSRYIEVPVAITTTYRDGSQRRYVGAYTLRRAVGGGARGEQRAWRIASADIREVQN